MFITINRCYGGFELPQVIWKALELNRFDSSIEVRTNTYLVDYVLRHGYKNMGTDLQVVEIPDNATDWMLNEHDGLESILYVVDGKIHRL